MLKCNNCGQNKHITEDNFIAFRNISGSETLYINCEDAYDIVDYGDSDTDSDGIENYQCPHCDGQDIDTDWEDEDDEIQAAQALRNNYAVRMQEIQMKRKNKQKKNERWDE
jgi:hypothetical protein